MFAFLFFCVHMCSFFFFIFRQANSFCVVDCRKFAQIELFYTVRGIAFTKQNDQVHDARI